MIKDINAWPLKWSDHDKGYRIEIKLIRRSLCKMEIKSQFAIKMGYLKQIYYQLINK